MALTYRPFSESHDPALNELDHDLHMNIPNGERFVFGLAGAAVILLAGKFRGFPQWLLLAAGTALFRRGWRGYSPAYAHLAIDPRHQIRGSVAVYGGLIRHTEKRSSTGPDCIADSCEQFFSFHTQCFCVGTTKPPK